MEPLERPFAVARRVADYLIPSGKGKWLVGLTFDDELLNPRLGGFGVIKDFATDAWITGQ